MALNVFFWSLYFSGLSTTALYLSVFVLHQGHCCYSGHQQLGLPHHMFDHRGVRAGGSQSGWYCRKPCGLLNGHERGNSLFPVSHPSSARQCRFHRSMCNPRLQEYRVLGEGEMQLVHIKLHKDGPNYYIYHTIYHHGTTPVTIWNVELGLLKHCVPCANAWTL